MVSHFGQNLFKELSLAGGFRRFTSQALPGAVKHHGETIGVVENAIRPGIRRDVRHVKGLNTACQDPDLNWGHGDFQSPALPTELSRHVAFATHKS